MDVGGARRTARGAGLSTAVLGALLVAAPSRVGAAVGAAEPRAARLIGLADLALAPGLVAGRPRWPWVAARAGLNVGIGAYALATSSGLRTRVVVVGLAAATVADLTALGTLRAARS